jgi:hypothetical protein
MIIARNTKAKTRSWTIGESPLGGLNRLGVIMGQVTKWGHPPEGLENCNLGGMDYGQKTTADSSASLRNDNKRTNNGKCTTKDRDPSPFGYAHGQDDDLVVSALP